MYKNMDMYILYLQLNFFTTTIIFSYYESYMYFKLYMADWTLIVVTDFSQSPLPQAQVMVKEFCLRHKHTRTKRKQKQQNIGSWKVHSNWLSKAKELKQLWEKHRYKLLWATEPQKDWGMRGSRNLWKWGSRGAWKQKAWLNVHMKALCPPASTLPIEAGQLPSPT